MIFHHLHKPTVIGCLALVGLVLTALCKWRRNPRPNNPVGLGTHTTLRPCCHHPLPEGFRRPQKVPAAFNLSVPGEAHVRSHGHLRAPKARDTSSARSREPEPCCRSPSKRHASAVSEGWALGRDRGAAAGMVGGWGRLPAPGLAHRLQAVPAPMSPRSQSARQPASQGPAGERPISSTRTPPGGGHITLLSSASPNPHPGPAATQRGMTKMKNREPRHCSPSAGVQIQITDR